MINEASAAPETHFLRHGFYRFPGAVPHEVINEFMAHTEECWDASPPYCFAVRDGDVVPLQKHHRHLFHRISDLHYGFARAGELIFPAPVLRLLHAIYRAQPVIFQSMMQSQSRETPFHRDEELLPVSSGPTLMASWTALNDVMPGSGEFEFVPGSQQVGKDAKLLASDENAGSVEAFMVRLHEEAGRKGLQPDKFLAKKGDVLLWSGRLLHRAAPSLNPALSRHSLICHFMPSGSRPLFYNATQLEEAPYPGGGRFLDRFGTAKVPD